MTPSDNLRPLFIEFARINGLFSKVGDEKETQNIAYVLPTYEVRSEVRLPYTKKELQGKLKSLILVITRLNKRTQFANILEHIFRTRQ